VAGRTQAPFAVRVIAERGAYALPILLTVILSLIAARRSEELERRFWTLLAAANAALFLCEVLLVFWLLVIDPLGPAPVTPPFHVLHAIAAACLIGVLTSMARISLAAPTARVRFMIDIAVLTLGAYALCVAFYARPVMGGAGGPPSHVLIGAGYPVAAFLMLMGSIASVAGFKIGAWRSWERLVVGSLAVYLIGSAVWPFWYASAMELSRNQARGILDLVQLTGHFVLMMATIYRLTEIRNWALRPLPPFSVSRWRWAPAVIPLASLVAALFAGAAAFQERSDATWLAFYSIIAIAIMALAIARTALLALEHSTLFHQAITDPLTGVYNHRFFHDRLGDELAAARRLNTPLGLIALDIDDFGDMNNRYGHTEGDFLLKELAQRIADVTGEHDVLARLGGDEFAIITPESGSNETLRLAIQIVDRVAVGSEVTSRPMTVSVGIASFPEHGTTQDELFRRADSAMLTAKSRGKNRVVVFESGRISDLNAHERVEQIERESRLSSVKALANAVDARDPSTRFHAQSVSLLATELSLAIGFSEAHAQMVGTAALLHDVGKIGLPDALLTKKGVLTDEEYLMLTEHSVLGERILRSTELNEILPWVRAHHEHWDGSGYPDGLRSEAIPLEARILALCDSFDEMTNDRPYRRAMSTSAALQEIDHALGAQFDPELAETFIRLLSDRSSVRA
jgi:diguanylate cyclase (GGDEF)-like protein